MMKKFLVVVALTILFAALCTGCDGSTQQKVSDAPLTLDGRVVGHDALTVHAQLSGNVAEKFFDGGQHVDEGQPLFKIDPREYESTILQAKTNLAKSVTNLAREQAELLRLEQSPTRDDERTAERRAAVAELQAEVEENQVLVQQAEAVIADTIVHAPITGRLGVDDVAVGTFVAANETALVTIGNFATVDVLFTLTDEQYQRLKDKPELKISLTTDDGTSDVIAEFERTTNEAGLRIVRATFKNPKGLLVPGMTVSGQINKE